MGENIVEFHPDDFYYVITELKRWVIMRFIINEKYHFI